MPETKPSHENLLAMAQAITSSTFGHRSPEEQAKLQLLLSLHVDIRFHDTIPSEHKLTVVGEVVKAFTKFCDPLPDQVVQFALLHLGLDQLKALVESLPRDADWVIWRQGEDQTGLVVSTRRHFDTCRARVIGASKDRVDQMLHTLRCIVPPVAIPTLVDGASMDDETGLEGETGSSDHDPRDGCD